MDALTVLTELAQVQEREALCLRFKLGTRENYREAYIVGACTQNPVSAPIVTRLLLVAEDVEVYRVKYDSQTLTQYCTICREQHLL